MFCLLFVNFSYIYPQEEASGFEASLKLVHFSSIVLNFAILSLTYNSQI